MEQSELLAVLSQVDVFRGLPPAALQSLAKRTQIRPFSTGAVLMRQGDISENMYVIVQGRVRVERSDPMLKGPLVLAELNPGDIVGELAVLDGEPRSATVTAIEPTTTLELSAPALALTVLQHPEVSHALLMVLSQRLRSTDQVAVKLLRKQLHKQWKPVAS
jgi:CRP/FNR family transcriptional regulator, cyclic AMP receptor protein